MLSCFSRIQLFATPMDHSPISSSIQRILQARILERVAIPSFRGSSWPRDWTWVSCITGGFFSTEPPGEPLWIVRVSQKGQRSEEIISKIILKYCVILKWRKSLNWKGTLVANPHQILPHRISEHRTQTNNSKSFQRKRTSCIQDQESE